MPWDYRRAARVEEALVNELGLLYAAPQRIAEIKLEVRKFLVMLEAAADVRFLQVRWSCLEGHEHMTKELAAECVKATLEATQKPAGERKRRVPTRALRR